MEGGDGIEECRVRFGSESSRWVDGSQVDSDAAQWSGFDDSGERFGSVRRRLVKKPRRVDSFDVEAMEVAAARGHDPKDLPVWRTLALAFQTLAVVYGDMGTSPLYVFADVFSKVPIESDVDILGALSLVMYTITLIPLTKYIFIVLRANDDGEGGTFALYSLICMYAKVNPLPNRQPADDHISNFKLKLPTPELERSLNVKEALEGRSNLKTLLLMLVQMGTSMIIGDGILTPAISGRSNARLADITSADVVRMIGELRGSLPA